MEVRCPVCQTSFKVGENGTPINPKETDGIGYLVPETVRTECCKENKKMTKTEERKAKLEAHISVDERYPYLNWYDWHRDMWGTKWNSSRPCWCGNEVWFDTAWSFCEPVIVELSKKFPNVRIDFQFADEDMGNNCDYGWCQNGFIDYANLKGNAAMKLAIDIWDDDNLYGFKDGEWKYIGD